MGTRCVVTRDESGQELFLQLFVAFFLFPFLKNEKQKQNKNQYHMQPDLAYFFLNSHFDLTDVTCFSWIFICIEASIFPIALFILFSSLFSQIISFFSRQSFDYYFYYSATSLNNNYSLRICTVYFPSKESDFFFSYLPSIFSRIVQM